MLNPRWDVEVDRVSSGEWSQILDLFDDANIYQTWSYGKIRWGAENLSHLVLRRDGEIVAAAQIRIIRPTKLKFGLAYLRWGPLCERRESERDSDVFLQMARALEEEYAGRRGLFLRVLPNAFVGSERAKAFLSAFDGYTSEPPSTENTYRTFVLDLAPTPAELRKRLDSKWRNQLTRSEKNNLAVITGRGRKGYRIFCDIYLQMMNRKKFDTTVDVEEFGRIQDDLPEHECMHTLIAESAGVPVAGLVASAMGDSAVYLLGATSDAGLTSKGAYLLHWKFIEWLKAHSIRWYDLGGIDPEKNPGVYHFKKGFSGKDVCQISPLTLSRSPFSAAMAKAGMAVQGAMRGSTIPARFARAIKQLATRN